MQKKRQITFTGMLLAAAAAMSSGCTKTPEPPTRHDRESLYTLLTVNARFGIARNILLVASDTISLTLDGATLKGVDAVANMWSRLLSGADLTSVSRTVLLETKEKELVLRDSGVAHFTRRSAPDTTFGFTALWTRENEGWRLVSDSIWTINK